MTYRIRWKNCNSSSAINDYIKDKLEKLNDFNFVKNNIKLEIVYYSKKKQYKVRINTPIKKFQVLRSEASNTDVITAINFSIDKTIDQLRRKKTNLENRKQGKK